MYDLFILFIYFIAHNFIVLNSKMLLFFFPTEGKILHKQNYFNSLYCNTYFIAMDLVCVYTYRYMHVYMSIYTHM